jgi:hypothetical protein
MENSKEYFDFLSFLYDLFKSLFSETKSMNGLHDRKVSTELNCFSYPTNIFKPLNKTFISLDRLIGCYQLILSINQ